MLLCCCPPTPPGADPPAGLYVEPPAWQTPGEAASARSSAAGSSAPGTGYLEGLHGASCPLLKWTVRFADKEKWKGKLALKESKQTFQMSYQTLNFKQGFDQYIGLPVLLADIGLWQKYRYRRTCSQLCTDIETFLTLKKMLGLVI